MNCRLCETEINFSAEKVKTEWNGYPVHKKCLFDMYRANGVTEFEQECACLYAVVQKPCAACGGKGSWMIPLPGDEQ